MLADEFYYFGSDGAALTGRHDLGRYPCSFSDEGKLKWGVVPVREGLDGQRSAVLVLPGLKIRFTK